MSEQHEPLEAILEPAIDEARIAAAWQRIRQARGGRRGPAYGRWFFGGAFAAAAAVALYLAWPAPPAGPLTSDSVALAAGTVLDAPAPRVVALDDRSELALAPGTQLEVLTNEGDRFVTQLQHGRVHFDVHPGGSRRWEVETGLATVEVVGTAFVVEANAERVVVEVERGVVMVRGERVPNRVARLTAGEHIIIEPGVKTADASRASSSGASSGGASSGGASSSGASSGGASSGGASSSGASSGGASSGGASSGGAPSGGASSGGAASGGAASGADSGGASRRGASRDASSRGASSDGASTGGGSMHRASGAKKSSRVTAQADAAAVASPRARSVGEALDEADQRRASGDPAGAAAVLERALANARRDEAAGMAAFTLGRIYLEDLRQPDRAASAFAQVIAIGVPLGLLEDAHARQIEALVRAKRTDDASTALATYDRLYPRGAHHTAVHALFPR